ncbi:transposable element Tcb1 transposase [Trichonephila clavipes]|nr:transposable element Tcb1 transposase [Trichonephila clavipes]
MLTPNIVWRKGTSIVVALQDGEKATSKRCGHIENTRFFLTPVTMDFKKFGSFSVAERMFLHVQFSLLFVQEIGSRVGRNQTTVLRICDLWMQTATTDRRGRSHPPQCTASLSARTIRRRLQQSGLSARRPLLGLPLTQNYRRLRRQWCDERRMWVAEWNEVVFTDESRICLQHHDGRIRVWRHRGERMLSSCVMHRHTDPAPGTMIELLTWLARSLDLSPIENMWSMVAERLTQITPPTATPDQLWQRVEAA